jgi:caa(3)-type oxidase subunit IV
MQHQGSSGKHHHHHILPYKSALMIWAALIVLTVITVVVAHIDLGFLNFVVAFVVASIKASLVALFFMNLKYDSKENAVIFSASFLFLAIFIVLTSADLFFRGDVYVKGPLVASAQAKSHFKKPWIATPELIAHGKELFQQQCITCHGPTGHGDGPAAAALNPHPRNFTSGEGWKNGRKPSQVFHTLTEGVKGSAMPPFATLPPDDRWSLAQFVLSLGPTPPTDTPADLAKIGIDPNKEGSTGGAEKPSIPIELAMAQMEEKDLPVRENDFSKQPPARSMGERLYGEYCIRCHGISGQGGQKVRNLGVNPQAFVVTPAFSSNTASLGSEARFDQVVSQGLPGDLMPGMGQLSKTELHELYSYIRSAASNH